MPLKKHVFPLRLPEERLVGVYGSVADAFARHDYLYVARYGQDNPELRGCALIMLGNRTGGERILDKHNVRTGRSCLYRAFAAWRSEDTKEAHRWIAEGKAAKDAEVQLDRLEILVARSSFRVVVHSRGLIFGHIASLTDLPEIELILTSYAPTSDKAKMLPVGNSLVTMVPPGKPVDLVFVYDPWMLPPGARELGAPVIFMMHDGELAYDAANEGLPDADLVAVQSTAEMIECGQATGTDCFIQYHFFPAQIDTCRLSKSLIDKTSRCIDLLFTGGMTQDFYRDKRQRVIPLAYEIDPRFEVKLYEGIMPYKLYEEVLKTARFGPVNGRCNNYISSRSFDLLANGVINLVDDACGVPFMFSEKFACFQTYDHQNPSRDIENHLHCYDAIVNELVPQAPRLEAELHDLIIPNKMRARRFVRDFLFMTHVIAPRLAGHKPRHQPDPSLFNQPNALNHYPDQLEKLIERARPGGPGTAAQWLRLAMAQAARFFPNSDDAMKSINEGLGYHPDSVSLHYARGLMLRSAGRYAEADDVFSSIASGATRAADDDPFPMSWEPLQGAYWIMDARIRARSTDKLAPLVREGAVWQSFALSHRADIVLRGIDILKDEPSSTEQKYRQTLTFAQQALDFLPHNDAAQRAYLRAVYGLFVLGDVACGEDFLQSFEAAKYCDGRIFNDFVAMAVDVLTQMDRLDEAEEIASKLRLFLKRVHMHRNLFFLYPEIQPLLVNYGLPHGNLRRC